jgi:predicted alpha/beta-fold hydrolase
VQAKDDPLIPFSVYDHPAFRENPCLTLIAVEHGGHLGFISRRRPRFWLDGVVIGWLKGQSVESPSYPTSAAL